VQGRLVFRFRKCGLLTDGVVDVTVEEEEPEDPTRGYVPCYHFRVSRHGDPRKVGEVRLRVASIEDQPSLLTSGQLGYEINEDARGHGFAARACLLVGPIALSHGLDPLIITCDPRNVASVRTCEHLGATLVGTFDVPTDHPMYQKGRRRVCRYEWHPGSPSGR